MAYERRSPDLRHQVESVARRWPDEWERARERPDGSRDDAFIRRLAWELHKADPNIGLNGKRGTSTISTDALAYRNPTAPGDAEVIDVINGANHTPTWADVTIPVGHPEHPEGVKGRYIEPQNPGDTTQVEDSLEARVAALEAACQGIGAQVQRNMLRIENNDRTLHGVLEDLKQLRGKVENLPGGVGAGVIQELDALRNKVNNLVIPAINSDARGAGPFRHFHKVPEQRVVDRRTLPPE